MTDVGYFTGILAIVAGITAYILNETDQTTREGLRAWVGVPDVAIKMLPPDSVSFVVSFKNVGKTPTRGLYIDADIVAGKDTYSAMEGMCAAGKKDAANIHSYVYNFSIIPGDTFLAIDPPRAKSFKKYSVAKLHALELPHIVACVVYGVRTDTKIHQTGLIVPLEFDGNSVIHGNIYAILPD
jgi:hypothetical protein